MPKDEKHKVAKKQLTDIAARQPTSERLYRRSIHAKSLAATAAGRQDLIEAEKTIAGDNSLQLDIVIRRVTRTERFEDTRQICVAHLMSRLHHDVQMTMFDSRDPIETKTRKPKFTSDS